MTDSKNGAGNESFVGRWSRRKLTKKPTNESVSNADPVSALNTNSDLPTPASVVVGNELVAQESENYALNEGVSVDLVEDQAEHDLVLTDTVSSSDTESEEPLLSDEDMPDISTLDAKSDVSPFFNKGVSETLRNTALRYVFSLPSYNIRDGLNDYDEDYTVFEPLGDTVTCDMKFHKERKERERLERLEEDRLEQERLEEQRLHDELAEQHDQLEDNPDGAPADDANELSDEQPAIENQDTPHLQQDQSEEHEASQVQLAKNIPSDEPLEESTEQT